jgi:23S rRNA (uridine2552-2'-O)-methyltransferase
LKRIKPFETANTQTLIGDITSAETQKLIEEILPTKADVIVSDVSPNVSGVWEVDHARQMDLASESLKLALKLLKKDGNFFVKVFQGDMFRGFVEIVREHFARVEIIKPKASRAKSAEVFVLGMGLKKSGHG